MMLASMVNAQILVKVPLIAEIMLFAKLPDIDQYVFVKPDMKDLVMVLDVLKLVAPITMIALEINGVVNQNAKILVLHLEHADVTPNAGRR